MTRSKTCACAMGIAKVLHGNEYRAHWNQEQLDGVAEKQNMAHLRRLADGRVPERIEYDVELLVVWQVQDGFVLCAVTVKWEWMWGRLYDGGLETWGFVCGVRGLNNGLGNCVYFGKIWRSEKSVWRG